MMTNETAHSGEMSLVWSAVFRVVRLLIFGFIGWVWFMSANDTSWRAVSLAAVLAVAALVGIPWYLSRARAKSGRRAEFDAGAENRWRAALDRYAEQEQAKRTYTRRNLHARPQSQDR
jgi:4-amino-4-deoxy-L-arabinose transferase-like glycosyltransferase